jgi:DNA-binding beta-propeller fold protein YncE
MILINRYILFIVLLFLFLSCRKDKPEAINPTFSSTAVNNTVLVANEGNFMFSNAALSLINLESDEVVEDVFKSSNNQNLGDVLQSVYEKNKFYYLIVNNSSKIEVIDKITFKSKAAITGLNSPRYMLSVSNSKAYVSDLYDKAIHIIDLNTFTKTGSISVNAWSEQMTYLFGKVFVTAPDKEYVYVINAEKDTLIDSILVQKNCYSILQDKESYIWVLSNGNSGNNQTAKLYKINPVNFEIVNSYEFGANDTPGSFKINGSLDTLYYLNKGVWALPINQSLSYAQKLISLQNSNYYGLGIHPQSGEIFVADALDYVQRGNVLRYNSKGELIKSYKVGIIPSDFVFK